MIGFLLSVGCLFGFVFAANRLLKIPFEQAPFVTVSSLGVLLFFFARFNHLKTGALILFLLGLILLAIVVIDFFRKPGEKMPDRWWQAVPFFFFLLLVFSFVIPMGMTFTVIDDYVWWGIVGKYLYLFDQLPDKDTTIISRHLSYTPGTSLIHYFFLRVMGEYKPAISYFAQNIILVSAMFVLIKKERLKQTSFLLAVCGIGMGLFCGSIFTKLQVDYLVSIYFFSVLWIWFDTPPSLRKIFVLAMPVTYLFLVKEIGFALSIFLLLSISADLLLKNRIPVSERLRMAGVTVLTGCLVFFARALWQSHCQMQGFSNFSGAVNLETIKASLNLLGNEQAQKGFFIFLKGLFFGESDRLNLPYLIWYTLFGFLWVKTMRYSRSNRKERISRIFKILVTAFFVYVLMNYFMQVIVFNIGSSYMHTVGLERYLNIYFVPMLLFSLIYYLNLRFSSAKISGKALISVVAVFILLNGLSRVETALRRETHFISARQIAQKIEKVIAPDRQNRVAVVPGENDNELWIQLLYYLLPNQVNHGRFPAGSKTEFLKHLENYDYVLMNSIGNKVSEWVEETSGQKTEAKSFYRIVSIKDETEGQPLLLERMF